MIYYATDFELCEETMECTVQGVPRKIRGMAWRILLALVKAKGRVLTRDVLIEQMYGWEDVAITQRCPDSHISQLRVKHGVRWIETMRGFGYRFNQRLLTREWGSEAQGAKILVFPTK